MIDMGKIENETMTTSNVEKFISGAIKSYFDKRMMVDALFWKEAIRLLTKKYKIQKQFQKEMSD